jgi:hypothetical protein
MVLRINSVYLHPIFSLTKQRNYEEESHFVCSYGCHTAEQLCQQKGTVELP